MADPQDEAPGNGEAGPGETAPGGVGAFERDAPDLAALAERDSRMRTKRKPMGPPADESRRAGAFNDEPPAPDVPPTTPT